MAPRAGFQFHRKFLSEQVVQTASELGTPTIPHAYTRCVPEPLRARAIPIGDRNEADAPTSTYDACLVSWIG